MPPPVTPGTAIDLRDFNRLNEKGSIKLQRLGPKTFQMLLRSFDSASGEELPPAVVPVNIQGIDQSIAETERQIEDLTKALEGLQAAKAEMERMEGNQETVFTASTPAKGGGQTNRPT